MDLGWPEVLLILAIVLIVFGVGKLPQIGSSMGKAIKEFRNATRGDDDQKDKPVNEAMAVMTDAPQLSAPVVVTSVSNNGDHASEKELMATRAKLAAAEAKLKQLEEGAK